MISHATRQDDQAITDSPAAAALLWRARLRQTGPPAPFRPVKIQPPPVPGSGPLVNVGIFAGIHGDEPAGTQAARDLAAWARRAPEELAGFALRIFPVCNPGGHRAGSRCSLTGMDLNREFWAGSDQPEVRALERELRSQRYDLIIALHEDDTSAGLYGFFGGHPLSEALLRRALRDAAAVLPLNEAPVIDGFPAEGGVIRDGYPGILSAPPEQRPRAVEIVFETPALAPHARRVVAATVAVKSILHSWREARSAGP